MGFIEKSQKKKKKKKEKRERLKIDRLKDRL